MAGSIARQFARWAANISFADLPGAVVDKMKAVLLQHLVAAAFGAAVPRAQQSVALVLAEEARADGATILGSTSKATRVGAACANTELMYAAGLYDYYRALVHPGPVLVSAALVNAELHHRSLRDVITALAVGYEFTCRLARDFVPGTAAHGFRVASVFGTMGAALTSARLMVLDEDRTLAAIALAASSASGLNEAGRSGGGDAAIHLPHAVRSGVFAAMMANAIPIAGAEQIIEGDSGFYRAFAGSVDGRLTYAYDGPLRADLEAITRGLGDRYELLTVAFHMYPLHGGNQPVIDLIAEMKAQHGFDAGEVERLTVAVNYIETQYPSPAFPRSLDRTPAAGSTHYYAAHAAVNGGYPQVGGRRYGPPGVPLEEDARVLRFMRERVTVVGEHGRPLFSPRVLVQMWDGRAIAGEYPYERMHWNFAQLLERLRDCAQGYPLGRDAFERLVHAAGVAESLDSVAPLYALLVPDAATPGAAKAAR